MKLLSAAQTREADAFTIKEEGMSSSDLMERAARAFVGWFENKFQPTQAVHIFCGPGNNGGDGLAVARLLQQRNYAVQVYLVGDNSKASADFKLNLERLPQEIPHQHLKEKQDITALPEGACVVDALFGTGLNRPVSGLYAEVINSLNGSNLTITAIDMPSGLYTDSQTPAEGAIVQANYTVSFQLPKLAFFLPQHEAFVGEWHIVPIGLSDSFIAAVETRLYFTTPQDVRHLLRPRKKFSHKGLYGHALLLSGGFGKMGAAVLAARACLRAGVGLLTIQVPATGYTVLQTAVPEAMTLADKHRRHLSELPKETDKFDVIGVGPGIGTERVTKTALGQLLATASQPLVVDADAINIIGSSDKLKGQLPPDKVIFTPHPKEFERLVGKSNNEYDRLYDMLDFCRVYRCYVVLKGNNTTIGTPDGKIFFNTTGNAGMATGGTGDVLTGIVTALVGQNYSLEEACLLGVYLHGLAGDLALKAVGEISMTASDVIDFLPQAFLKLQA
ncbi:NAD(P)H-hydrate epimerase [Pontibacter ummariensis]|uniref:Bifunctional NAD(P)H-hydrate repair enzyme n=1 Tax=Pontibacter ummariensis TaxID=1610492 RepID=A0A239CUU2_9BACT|nr:NAD(P)H-hydrate dehydratase [Pontibacter ummariensis]PRY14811.1 NAD(P)H-hydrate epimerase [Pontibacter ummariensis]SNS23996.1 NAD(P)H-hydrate epimerase [Pontibacter ummariensis]